MVIQISYILYIRKNSFIYACNSQNGIKERLYPYILNQISNMFEYKYCQFFLSKKKKNSSRGFVFKSFKYFVKSFTIEISYMGYVNKLTNIT